MKRFLLPVALVAGLTQSAMAADSTFTWRGVFNEPVPLQVDATNFVNEGVFNVNIPVDQITAQTLYYQTSDTLNYTNTGSMFGNPGYDVGFFPTYFIPPVPGVPFNRMSANFVNQRNGFGGGNILCSAVSSNILGLLGVGFNLGGSAKFIASATNIINTGSIILDNTSFNNIFFGFGNAFSLPPVSSLLSLTGENIDLRGGELAFTSSSSVSNIFGVTSVGVTAVDYAVGTDTNGFWNPGVQLTPNTAYSSYFLSVNNPFFYQQMFLSNSIPYSFTALNGPSNIVTRAVFLQDTSPGVTANVFFGGSGVGSGAAHIEWSAPFIDPETAELRTNFLYLSDLYAAVTTNTFVFNGIPQNYTFSQGVTPQFGLGAVETPNMPFFNVGSVSNLYSYVDALLVPTMASTNNIFGGSITNLSQRIHITATRTLKLDDARISGPDYLSLKSTNQFEGNIGASISVPFADLNLGVTNGFLTISNLMRPTLPRWSGTIQAFTGRWFDVDANGITNDNRVLLVNSHLNPTTIPQIQDLTLHATNSLVISDALSVFRKISIDATYLTLTTNGPGAMSPVGQLNFLSPSIVWSDSLPRLKYLTNSGVITAPNQMFFAGNMSSPYSNPNLATPYEAFVNHGSVTNQGSFIVAKYFVNDGIFQGSVNGNFKLIAGCAFLTNGAINAPAGAGDISISANNLVISNHNFQAGGRISLAVSNCYSDGFSLFNQFGHLVTTNTQIGIVSNGNYWAMSGNFSMLARPATGDLLGTTISNAAAPFATVLTTWAGQDRGCAPTGYVNNLAVGRLILNGSTGSKFSFAGAGTGNAIYVDRLELIGSVTNLGAAGLTNILIGSNMRVYYAQAIANGESIAEKLAGLNGGRFCWVSNYAGVFSSTNITVNFTNYTFNQALVESENIDSDGDYGLPGGNVNRYDPTPFPAGWVFDVVVSNAPCECDAVPLISSGFGSILGSGQAGNVSGSSLLMVPLHHSPTGTESNLFRRNSRTYHGLFYETNGVARQSAGYFSGSLTKSNYLLGSLRLGANTYPVSGRFDPSGHLVKTNLTKDGRKPSKSLPLTADLQLSLGGDQITGQIISSNWVSPLLAYRVATNAVAGRFTFVIPGDDVDSTNSPAGHGFGTLDIFAKGGLSWGGTLADKTTISRSSGISDQGLWPLYATPYAGHAGLVLGWIQFDADQTKTDLAGEIIWIKPGGLSGKYYPAGFTNQIGVVGSTYVKPPVTTTNGAMVLAGGNLGSPITNIFVLKPNYTAVNQGVSKFNLTITKNDGVFHGNQITATVPAKQTTKFQGVLLQKMGIGAGFFLGTNESGSVWYTPLP